MAERERQQLYVREFRDSLRKLVIKNNFPIDLKLYKNHSKDKQPLKGDLIFTWNNIYTSAKVGTLLPSCQLYSHIEDSLTSDHHLILKLYRPIVCKNVVQSTLKSIGNEAIKNEELCSSLCHKHAEISLTELRRRLVMELLEAIMEKNSFDSDLLYNDVESKHYNVGEVTVKQSKLSTSNDLYECCLVTVKLASENKFETTLTECDLEASLMPIVDACVKFNLLLSNPKKALKIDLDESNERLIKSGSFVMYNYARLATLMEKFYSLVECNHYPNLPSVDEIDFSLLHREDEWHLIRDFIMWYPIINDEISSSFTRNDIPPIHKIYHFLLNLTHKLSAYYCSVHILGDSQPHLLPTMFARLYLVKTIVEVMRMYFQLMRITPLPQI